MLKEFQIKGVMDRLAGGILSKDAVQEEIYRCNFNVTENREQLEGLRYFKGYFKEKRNSQILENNGWSPNSDLTQAWMLSRAIEDDHSDANVLEEIVKSYNYGNSIKLKLGLRDVETEDSRYTLMTGRGAEVCLYKDGELLVLYGEAKTKPLDIVAYSAISKKVTSEPRGWMSRSRFNDWINDRLYVNRPLNANLRQLVQSGELEDGALLTSSGKILYGHAYDIGSRIFELAQNDNLIINRNSDEKGNIRFPKDRKAQLNDPKARTEGQRYLESFSPETLQGRIFSDGGSYKAYAIGGVTFAEFDLDQNATYVFRTPEFSPEGFLSRKNIRENGSLGYIGRIIHRDMDSWKKQVDEHVRSDKKN